MVTQLKEDLGQITEEDQGVKTLKRKLLASVETRMGHFEQEEYHALSCMVDPRCWLSGFSNDENRVKARLLLIEKIKEIIPVNPEDRQRNPSNSSQPDEPETKQQAVKRRRLEKQQEVRQQRYAVQQYTMYSSPPFS